MREAAIVSEKAVHAALRKLQIDLGADARPLNKIKGRETMFRWLAKIFGAGEPKPTGKWHVAPPEAQLQGEFRTMIVGITFRNYDGSSRQAAIARLRPGMRL